MKMSMLLMTMVLLVGAASATHDVNLKAIFKEISNLNQTSTLDHFVEDLTHLSEGVNKCGDAFFCKVQDILVHQNFSRSVEEEEEKEKPKKMVMEKIMKNLKNYINHRNVSCSQVLKDVKTSKIRAQAFQFWERIKSCIRYWNLHRHK